jgi:hypothetical protein
MKIHAVCPGAVLFGLGLLAHISLTPVARAGVLYSNFGPGLSYDITSGNPVGNAFDGSLYAEGNSFTPSVTSPLATVTLALSCAAFCPAPDPITVTLNGDSSDQPGPVLETFVIPGAVLGTLGNNNPPRVLSSILHPVLVFGTRYWVTVSSDLNDSVAWNLNTRGDTSDQAISTDGGATWFSPSGLTPGALEVDGTVPEPGSAPVLAGAALILWLLRKRTATSQPW